MAYSNILLKIMLPSLYVYHLLLTMHTSAVISATSGCLFRHEIKESPYLQFPIRPGLSCWEFCKHLPDCTAFSFRYDRSGLCSFYNLQDQLRLGSNFSHKTRSFMVYTGAKVCLSSSETQRILHENEDTKGGILIQQNETGACLTVRQEQESREEEWLMWIEDCRDASLWLIERLNMTYWGHLVKIKDTSSRRCISIMPSRNYYEDYLTLLAMENCSDSREQSQLFILAPADIYGTRFKLLTNHGSLKEVGLARPIPFHPLFQEMLMARNFLLVKPHLPCDRFTVEHGSLLVDPSQPFHVPGETIPVLCHPGYGVKTEAGNYSQYFTTVCSPNLEVPECVNTSPNERLSFERTVVMSSIVFYVIVFVETAVILFLLFLMCFQQKEMQQLQSIN